LLTVPVRRQHHPGGSFAADAVHGRDALEDQAALDSGNFTYPNGVVGGSVAVEHGLVYVAVNQLGKPFQAALDEQTGVEQWRSYAPADSTAHTYGSPIVYPGKAPTLCRSCSTACSATRRRRPTAVRWRSSTPARSGRP
jgi:hypothetical protein